MRVVIISWDGLEYDMVEKYDCRNLLQAEHGKIDLEPYFETRVGGIASREPLTSEVYAIFLTGLLPNQLGQKFEWNGQWVGILKKKPSFFDLAEKPYSVDVPGHSVKSWMDRLTGHPLFDAYWKGEVPLERVEKAYYNHMEAKAGYLDLIIRFGYNPIMLYFKEPDKLGHIYSDKFTGKYERLYRFMDHLTGKMINPIPDDFIVLVHSDHGMNGRGWHTPYGFWSLNVAHGRDSYQLQEWYGVIKEWLEKPVQGYSNDVYSPEEKEEVVGRLKEMGYL